MFGFLFYRDIKWKHWPKWVNWLSSNSIRSYEACYKSSTFVNKIDTPNKETKCQFLVIDRKINSNFLIGNSSLISGQCYFSILCVLKGIWRSLVFCSSWIQTENIRSNELSYWPLNLIRSYQACYKISTLVNKRNMSVKCQQQI